MLFLNSRLLLVKTSKVIHHFIKFIFLLSLTALLVVFTLNIYIVNSYFEGDCKYSSPKERRMIVILGGGNGSRLTKGNNIYNEGDIILLTGVNELESSFRQIELDWRSKYLISNGVNPDSLILDTSAQGSLDEMKLVIKIANRLSVSRVLVISDQLHFFRLKFILQYVDENELNFYFCPASLISDISYFGLYDRKTYLYAFMELIKLSSYLVYEIRTMKITAIILTLNEEDNLEPCLASIVEHVDQIIVVDSFSLDRTKDIAMSYDADFYQNKFINQARQFNWALDNTKINNDWVLRIDADERWSNKGFDELYNVCQKDPTLVGINVRMKIYFMDRWIKRGGNYPNNFLRVFNRHYGRVEDRWMDEHIKVQGNVCNTTIDVTEYNYDRQIDISGWIDKHNNYATREALAYLLRDSIEELEKPSLFENKTSRKRWLKDKVYYSLPMFVRPICYFFYRYIFQLGLLDGREGAIYHFLHAFWYRFLVDLKVKQVIRFMNLRSVDLKQAAKLMYDIEI